MFVLFGQYRAALALTGMRAGLVGRASARVRGPRAMRPTSTAALAENVIAIPRAHELELRQAGIRRLSLFGSVARVTLKQTVIRSVSPVRP